MKLRFCLQYITRWGEQLYVTIEYVTSKGKKRRIEIPMNTDDGQYWWIESMALDSSGDRITLFKYIYEVRNSDGKMTRREWSLIPRLVPFRQSLSYVMNDAWRDIPDELYLFTNAYQTSVHGVLSERFALKQIVLYGRTLLFYVSAPQLRKGQSVALCGSHPALGSWNASRYIMMQYAGQSMWVLSVNAVAVGAYFEYKYVTVDNETGDLLDWEDGDNRSYDCRGLHGQVVHVINGGMFRTKAQAWRASGVSLSVLSLIGGHSCGAGDFGLLKLVVDWAERTGMKVLSLQPINDIGEYAGTGSNPFSVISVHAIDPVYIDLEAVGAQSDCALLSEFHNRFAELGMTDVIDVESARKLKLSYLHHFFKTDRTFVENDDGYKRFVSSNSYWLPAYAAFCILSKLNSTHDFHKWPDFSSYDDKQVDTFLEANKADADFIYYVQYHLHMQLERASAYARSKGIFLMCDVSERIAEHSVEVWMNPKLFVHGLNVGVKPDEQHKFGKKLEVPVCDWHAANRSGNDWWQRRFLHIGKYFDGVCLNNVKEYFLNWVLNGSATNGVLGHFIPSLPYSPGEIEQRGLKFRKEFFTKPFINDTLLNRLFGAHSQYVKTHFLDVRRYGMYELRHDYDTQVKINEYFSGRTDENSIWIRDGLLRLVENVLFVEDALRPGMYHPRIYAYREFVYNALSDNDRGAFMRLYYDYYFQRNNSLWAECGFRNLSGIFSDTTLLVCADGMGKIPEIIAPVLQELRMLAFDIQIKPKMPGLEFTPLNANRYLSVATISTFGMPPLRVWWRSDHRKTQRFYSQMLQKDGIAPTDLPAGIAEEIIARHLYCPSMLCVLSVEDWLAMDPVLCDKGARCRQAVHGPVAVDCWRRRMRLNIEQVMTCGEFNNKIRTMIKRSRR